MNLILKPLAECLEYIDQVAAWHDDAWGYLRPNQPHFSKQLYSMRLNQNIPITYVIFQNELAVGMFSLVRNTFDIGNPELIMLNNVYVIKENRGFGIGKEIINLAEEIAKTDFNISTLQLGTVERSLIEFYQKLGWLFTVEDKLSDTQKIFMMEKSLTLQVKNSF